MRAPTPRPTVLLLGAALLWAGSSDAAGAQVTSDTALQVYDLRSPTGDVVLTRRRLVTTLGASVDDLGARGVPEANEPELALRLRLRYDADFGELRDHALTGLDHYVPGGASDGVDLLYGYVEGRRLLGGRAGFRIGRQYTIDMLGFYAFDGVEAKVALPCYVAIEAYGGLEVRGGLPFSASRFEAQGMWRGDRAGLDAAAYTPFQQAAVAPVVALAAESAGLPWMNARVTYRRVDNTGDATTNPFASAIRAPYTFSERRLSQERLGAGADATLRDVGTARAGLVYDLHGAQLGDVYAGVETRPTKRLALSTDVDHARPLFDGDSIWSFFVTEPTTTLGLRGSFEATRRWALSLGTSLRSLHAAEGTWVNAGGIASARYHSGATSLGARATGEGGQAGERSGGELFAEQPFLTRFVAQGRASVFSWDDRVRPTRSTTSYGYVAGLGYLFGRGSRAQTEWEHSGNRLVGQRFRLLFLLSLAVVP